MKKTNTSKKLLLVLMSMVMAIFCLAGCGSDEKKADEAAATEKVLLVGTEPTFAPFEFQKDDKFEGFDMDLIRAVGKQMGKEVKIQNMGFDALIPALNSGNIDVSAAGMSITPERQKAVDMSDPYYTSGLIIVVNNDNNAVKSVKDLEGKTISVQIGTTGAAKAESIKDAKVKTFNTNAEVFLELQNKGADAVIIDKPVAGYYLVNHKDAGAKLVGDTMEAESYGFAMKKDSKLTAEVNKALAELKENGEYKKIYEKWFGAEAAK